MYNLLAQLSCVTIGSMASTLRELTDAYREATKALDEAREALIEGIRRDRAAGKRPADILREIDHEWTSEYLRKIFKG
ncbi:hypothetical protein CLV71_124142 [Actinophytocola oryzae]|uniref:Uncharacterized protein n=2 Tax=Actinophytocola oryzae TaxID=502181 RepID=A0A4R7UTY2_9PSEU|nr:hypothetical protein CLV71_124142 [Actinophytocola oryzae]